MSVTGPPRATPALPRASMSYLMFWPTFSIAGSARIGRSAASVADSSSTLATGRPAHGQVIGLAGLPAERQPDQIGPKRVDGGRLGVDAKPGLAFELVEKRREPLRV